MPSEIKPPLLSLLFAVVGVLCLGAAVHFYAARSATTAVKSAKEGTPPMSDKPNVPGKNSPNISAAGNVTIGHVGDVYNKPPPPQLRIVNEQIAREANGAVVRTITLEVAADTTPSTVTLQVIGEDIIEGDVRASSGILYNQMTGDTLFQVDVPNPRGQMQLILKTKTDKPLKIGYQF
jgi:hypothetical protein